LVVAKGVASHRQLQITLTAMEHGLLPLGIS
jgi:hypothetical protein